ncbi:GNAT family N-acetyltransferase [Liquorilactobacillus sucicola]|uniref:GNAT family N-acetyltransferase n=1 Tax=Liquorilactobacillus sucicola TaxID=519050 RepID=UPI001268B727|nr:GNAT family N-acetyltransferase [Liquorilactobacillus sucicola]
MKLSSKDAENLTVLLHRAYQANEVLGIHFKAASVDVKDVRKHLLSVPTYGYKDEKGKIVSTVSVRLPWSYNAGPFNLPHLGWITTDPAYQHQGYGKSIINDVLEQYVKKVLNAPAVTLGTAVEHPWLQETYISLGFTPIEEVRKFSDHKTVYLIKTFDVSLLEQVSDEHLQRILRKQAIKGEKE